MHAAASVSAQVSSKPAAGSRVAAFGSSVATVRHSAQPLAHRPSPAPVDYLRKARQQLPTIAVASRSSSRSQALAMGASGGGTRAMPGAPITGLVHRCVREQLRVAPGVVAARRNSHDGPGYDG